MPGRFEVLVSSFPHRGQCDCYLVTKLSASRSSTVCLSMLGGTNSRPFLAQRVARLGDRIWHTQRFGQICARTAMATASIMHSNSLSMVTTPPGHGTCNMRQIETKRGRHEKMSKIEINWSVNDISSHSKITPHFSPCQLNWELYEELSVYNGGTLEQNGEGWLALSDLMLKYCVSMHWE